MTIQYKYSNSDAWHDLEFGEYRMFAQNRQAVVFREKPSFEPGYFVLVQDVRADGAPWLVKWFDENPGNDWDRAVVVNDHLD